MLFADHHRFRSRPRSAWASCKTTPELQFKQPVFWIYAGFPLIQNDGCRLLPIRLLLIWLLLPYDGMRGAWHNLVLDGMGVTQTPAHISKDELNGLPHAGTSTLPRNMLRSKIDNQNGIVTFGGRSPQVRWLGRSNLRRSRTRSYVNRLTRMTNPRSVGVDSTKAARWDNALASDNKREDGPSTGCKLSRWAISNSMMFRPENRWLPCPNMKSPSFRPATAGA